MYCIIGKLALNVYIFYNHLKIYLYGSIFKHSCFILRKQFSGFFEGMTLNNCYITLPYYFHKKRGLALGLQAVSISVGQILSPLFIRYLITEFGFRGSIIIETGVAFNCCVAAALLRPLKPKQKQRSIENPKEISRNGNLEGKKTQWTRKLKSLSVVGRRVKANIIQAFGGFKSYRVMLYSITHATFLCGYLNFVTLLPFAMFNEGHDYGYAAVALSIAAISSTSARVLMSLVADRKWFPKFKVYTVMTLLSAAACFCKVKNNYHSRLFCGIKFHIVYWIWSETSLSYKSIILYFFICHIFSFI